MDPVVSVVNLEDEFPSSELRNRDQLDDSLLNVESTIGVGSEFENTNLASGLSSGACSSPPEPTILQSTGLGQEENANDADDGDRLIRDVIDQLERQCSTTDDDLAKLQRGEISIEVGGQSLPSASTLFKNSPSPATTAFEKHLSPMVVGDRTEKEKSGFYYSMWIASAKTRETLALLPTTGDGRICYTMPGIMVDDSLGDPTVEALRKHCGDDPSSLASYRRAHRSAAAQINIPTMLELVASGDFRAAVDVSGKLLKNFGQGMGKAHQPSRNNEESLKIWCLRFHLLVNVGQYNLASSEMEAFGNLDGPDLYFEYYPETYRGRKGSMVPFSMRLLHAELPRLIGQHQESLIRLNRILAVVRQIIKNINDGSLLSGDDAPIALTLWRRRQRKAQHALARCLLAMKDFRLVAKVYEGLIDDSIGHSLSGRVHLMLGSSSVAKTEFQKYQTVGDDSKTKSWSSMHNGYVNAFNNNFADALVDFQKAAQYDSSNIYATNNAAVCFLYLGRLNDAVSILETALHQNPAAALQEGICTNLCTLYELESARSTQKKIDLLKSINQYQGDGFNVTCLKLPA